MPCEPPNAGTRTSTRSPSIEPPLASKNRADKSRRNRRRVEVRAALKAMACIGMEAMTARRAAHRHGLEPRSFDEDVLGVRRNHRVPAAHYAGETQRLRMIGDDQVLWIERSFYCHPGS